MEVAYRHAYSSVQFYSLAVVRWVSTHRNRVPGRAKGRYKWLWLRSRVYGEVLAWAEEVLLPYVASTQHACSLEVWAHMWVGQRCHHGRDVEWFAGLYIVALCVQIVVIDIVW